MSISKSKHMARFSFDIRGINNEILTKWSDIKIQKKTKPIICGVQKNSESYNVLREDDLIISVNNKKVKNFHDLLKIRKKLKWGKKVKFKIKRNGKFVEKNIFLDSFEKWKKKIIQLGINVIQKQDLLTKKNFVEVSNIDILSSAKPGLINEFFRKILIETGDIIISLNSKKIKSIKDWDFHSNKLTPGETAIFEVKKSNNNVHKIKIKIINYNGFLKLNEKLCRSYWPKKAADILLKEYEENDFYLSEKRKENVIKKYSDEKYKEEVFEPLLKKFTKKKSKEKK